MTPTNHAVKGYLSDVDVREPDSEGDAGDAHRVVFRVEPGSSGPFPLSSLKVYEGREWEVDPHRPRRARRRCYPTPEEAALREWDDYRNAQVFVVALVYNDAEIAEVSVDTVPSHPITSVCRRESDGWVFVTDYTNRELSGTTVVNPDGAGG